ncbi:MAG: InlB B-repeat-containing protein [Lachnospiraceae bacterium]|nr:InlB B-repeat-containing protein [Lachnospiraceae bacterium]
MKKMVLSALFLMLILFAGTKEKVFAEEVKKMEWGSLEAFINLKMPTEKLAETKKEAVEVFHDASLTLEEKQWQQYGSKYFYNQLNETEQIWWDTLDALGMRYLTGNESLIEQDSYTMADGYVMEYYITPPVAYEGLTAKRASEILFMFRYSNPQYYFFQTMTYSTSNAADTQGSYCLTMYPAFADGEARAKVTAQLKEKIDVWVSVLDTKVTDFEKEKAAYDLICNHIAYDKDYEDIALRNPYGQSIYSLFFTENTVCAGYAQTMQLLMNAVGIDCAAVTSEGHEWNIIRINDTWYNVDPTWGDLDGESGYALRYTYFNRSTEEFLGEDSYIISNHTVLDYWKELMPELTFDSGADFFSEGKVHIPVEKLEAPVIFADKGMAEITAKQGACIYYTVNGEMPTIAENKSDCYRIAFPVEDGDIIRAIAVKNASWDSEVTEFEVETINHTVQFYTYSGSKVETQEVSEGSTLKKPSDPVWSGYQFCGWYTDAAYVNAYDFSAEVTEDFILYAKWIRGVYTVRFYSNGGNDVASQHIKEREMAVCPQTPVRNGYIFAGWYTDAALTRPYNFTTPVLADVILYAKWQGWTYPLRLNANGGYIGKKSVAFQTKKVVNGELYGALPEAKKKGCLFKGWYTKRSGGMQITKKDRVYLTGNCVLYAQWEVLQPSKAVITSLTNKTAKTMLITIKNTKRAKGYQIRYSRKVNMKSAKKVRTSGDKAVISGLKKGGIYYVQVRMYQKDSVGKLVYGAWSNKKSIKIKK